MNLNYPDHNGFDVPVKNKKVAAILDKITNDYDLLDYVKNNITFFLESRIIDAEWFSRFDPEILKQLNIFTSGRHCVEVKKDFNALVIDATVDIKTYNDAMLNIRYFGKGNSMLFLNAKSVANLKLYGLSNVELIASDHCQANVNLRDKSSFYVQAHKNSFIAVKNRSRGRCLIGKGEDNVIINQ